MVKQSMIPRTANETEVESLVAIENVCGHQLFT